MIPQFCSFFRTWNFPSYQNGPLVAFFWPTKSFKHRPSISFLRLNTVFEPNNSGASETSRFTKRAPSRKFRYCDIVTQKVLHFSSETLVWFIANLATDGSAASHSTFSQLILVSVHKFSIRQIVTSVVHFLSLQKLQKSLSRRVADSLTSCKTQIQLHCRYTAELRTLQSFYRLF